MSGDRENDLYSSVMPDETESLEFMIIEMENPSHVFFRKPIPRPAGGISEETFEPVPLVKVKVIVTANDRSGSPLAVAEEVINVLPGPNTVYINLGDYDLDLKAEPQAIFLTEDITSSAEETPLKGQTMLTAELSFIPQPGSPNLSEDINTENKTVEFEIDPILSTTEGTLTPASDITGADGQCSVELSAEKEGKIVVLAKCRPNSGNPDDVYVASCTVPVINSKGKEVYKVILYNINDIPLIPNFSSPVLRQINTWPIMAKLVEYNPYTNTEEPVGGKEIKFTITDRNDVKEDYEETNGDGECQIYYTIEDPEPREITVTAEFTPEPFDDITTSFPMQTSFRVTNSMVVNETFDKYTSGTRAYELINWVVDGAANPDSPGSLAEESYVENGILQLYAEDAIARMTTVIGGRYYGTLYQLRVNYEYRINVRIGSSVPSYDQNRGSVRLYGIYREYPFDDYPDVIWREDGYINFGLPLIVFTGDNIIEDCNENQMSSYSPGTDYSIRLQVIPVEGSNLDEAKLYYSITEGNVSSPIFESEPVILGNIRQAETPYPTVQLRLETNDTTMWFDEITVYSLDKCVY